MNIRKRVFFNNITIGLVPIIVVFTVFILVNSIQVKRKVDADMRQIASTFKVALNSEMQKYLNYADMMFYNLYTQNENGTINFGGNFPDSTAVLRVLELIRYFIAYTDMKIFECYISNKVTIREIYSWEQNRYITSDEEANYIWNYMINPLNKPGFKMVFPDVISNVLVLRHGSLAVQPYTQSRIGFNLISVPVDEEFLLNFPFRSPWFHYVVETAGGYVFDSDDFNNPRVINQLQKYSNTNSVTHLVNFGEMGKYYYYRENLYRLTEKISNVYQVQDIAYIGILYDYEAYNSQFLLYQKLTLMIFGLLFALVFFVSILFYRKITNPILDLKKMVEKFEESHEPIPQPEVQEDEITELADSFSHMSETIIRESDALARSKQEAEDAINLLDGVADKMNATLNAKQIANLLIEESRRYIQFDTASVLLHNEKKKMLEGIAVYGDMDMNSVRFQVGKGIAGDVFKTGKPAFTNDTSKDSRFIRMQVNPRSIMSVPIKSKDKTIGVFNMDSDGTVKFTEDKLKWFNILLAIAGVAMENATLYQNLESKVRERTHKLAEANKTLALQTEELANERNKLKIQNEIIGEELELAKRIQLQLIPDRSPAGNIAYYYRAMEQVGGDFFDFITLPNGDVGIFISDVSGHGVPAAFVTSIIKSFSSQAKHLTNDPAAYLHELNEFLIRLTAGHYVTAFYGIYSIKDRKLTYCNAGHNAPLCVDRDGNVSEIYRYGNLALAIYENSVISKLNKEYRNETFETKKGSKIVFFTDGMTEAVNILHRHKAPNGHTPTFEDEELFEMLKKHRNLNPTEYIDKIVEGLTRFRGSDEFDDDVCIICLES